MSQDLYFAANESDRVELERLDLLHQIFDPMTIRHVETLGIAPGWKCLDVGAGGGSVARWLCERTGPEGRTVATDVDTRFLDRLNVPNLEVRRHNIVTDALEEDCFDLVHCRLLLMHKMEYQKAVERMAKAVRPGGWLLIEELDWISSSVNNSDHPRATLHNNWNHGFLDGMKQKRIFDGYLGRHVRSVVEGLGFVDVSFDGIAISYRGGELFGRWTLMNGTAILGKATDEESVRILENARVIYMDPAFYHTAPTLFSAWGRKPG